MNSEFDPFVLVGDFQRIFETSSDPVLWGNLIAEETTELYEAVNDETATSAVAYYSQVLKEAADLVYVLTGWANLIGDGAEAGDSLPEDLFLYAGNLLDLVRSVVGSEALQEAIELVHQSNLSKLGDDGKPLRREDGKILKGPNYQPPNLDAVAARVITKLNKEAA